MSQSHATDEMTYEGNAVPPKKNLQGNKHGNVITLRQQPQLQSQEELVFVPVPYLAIQPNPTFFSSLRE